ncbi:MAG: glutamate formimidoyltransferase [archaeon]
MKKIIACVPNFSEGRDIEKIDSIASAVSNIPGVELLDRHVDPDHNRAVLTFAGEIAQVSEAAFQAVKKATEIMTLENHSGEHPRIGVADVVPFVPVLNSTLEECAEAAREVGKRIGNELNLPVYLYGSVAANPSRENLANIRKGQYESIRAEIEHNPERKPDFGPSKISSAGAVAVGTRRPLIAFNINLDTSDVSIAKKIAEKIRESSGGLKSVRALGLFLKSKGIAQVSMNLTNFRETGITQVFEAVESEADALGVSVKNSELIGLAPRAAFEGIDTERIKLENFTDAQILEKRLGL